MQTRQLKFGALAILMVQPAHSQEIRQGDYVRGPSYTRPQLFVMQDLEDPKPGYIWQGETTPQAEGTVVFVSCQGKMLEVPREKLDDEDGECPGGVQQPTLIPIRILDLLRAMERGQVFIAVRSDTSNVAASSSRVFQATGLAVSDTGEITGLTMSALSETGNSSPTPVQQVVPLEATRLVALRPDGADEMTYVGLVTAGQGVPSETAIPDLTYFKNLPGLTINDHLEVRDFKWGHDVPEREDERFSIIDSSEQPPFFNDAARVVVPLATDIDGITDFAPYLQFMEQG